MGFVIAPRVRVRREDFGLLFFDTRSARLTFVRCGQQLVPLPADTSGSRELVTETGPEDEEAVTRLLWRLVTKGLVIACGPAD